MNHCTVATPTFRLPSAPPTPRCFAMASRGIKCSKDDVCKGVFKTTSYNVNNHILKTKNPTVKGESESIRISE